MELGHHDDAAIGESSVDASETSEEEISEQEEEQSWISWFCSIRGNEFFAEVDEDYIQDEFNLTGLSAEVPYFDYALDTILDVDSPNADQLTEEQQETVDAAAELLYGLIHARFILTSKGLNAMFEKFSDVEFGRCPRVHCGGQPLLPAGQSDLPRKHTVCLFCPRCADIFHPRSSRHANVDGAYFGTTFAHLFLMTFPQCHPEPPAEAYVPRVFGFRIRKAPLPEEGKPPSSHHAGRGGDAGGVGAVANAGAGAVPGAFAGADRGSPHSDGRHAASTAGVEGEAAAAAERRPVVGSSGQPACEGLEGSCDGEEGGGRAAAGTGQQPAEALSKGFAQMDLGEEGAVLGEGDGPERQQQQQQQRRSPTAHRHQAAPPHSSTGGADSGTGAFGGGAGPGSSSSLQQLQARGYR